MSYKKIKYDKIQTLKDYFNYRFDILEDSVDILEEDLNRMKFRSGPRPDLNHLKFLIELYKEYWYGKDSVGIIEIKYNLTRCTLQGFIRRNGLDVKCGNLDKAYFRQYGMSRSKYKEKWGSYSVLIEKESDN